MNNIEQENVYSRRQVIGTLLATGAATILPLGSASSQEPGGLNFVQSLNLGDAPFKIFTAANVLGGTYEPPANDHQQAYIVKGATLSFVDGLSVARKEDCLNSVLLAHSPLISNMIETPILKNGTNIIRMYFRTLGGPFKGLISPKPMLAAVPQPWRRSS